MAVVKMRRCGQLTIPQSLRKDLHLDDEAVLTVVKAGNVLLMTARPLPVDCPSPGRTQSVMARRLELNGQ